MTDKSAVQVTGNSVVLAHFAILLDDGSVADSTRMENKPMLFNLSDDSLVETLKEQLLGLKKGEKKAIKCNGDDLFGPASADNIQFMDIHQFSRDIELQPGLLIAFEGINGEAMPGLIREVLGDSVKVDFNHPLSGKELTLDLEVLSVDTLPNNEETT